jgi:hypothetical protein
MACKGTEKWSFDVLAGAAVLLCSPQPGCCHYSSAADYAAELVFAFGVLRGVLIRGRHLPAQDPLPWGGTANTAAIRAFAEIEHWLSIAHNSTDDISAACMACTATLCTGTSASTQQHIIRLPASPTIREKIAFVIKGYRPSERGG